jgi:hypothetical protein
MAKRKTLLSAAPWKQTSTDPIKYCKCGEGPFERQAQLRQHVAQCEIKLNQKPDTLALFAVDNKSGPGVADDEVYASDNKGGADEDDEELENLDKHDEDGKSELHEVDAQARENDSGPASIDDEPNQDVDGSSGESSDEGDGDDSNQQYDY